MEALESGADGYLLKSHDPSEVLVRLRALIRGTPRRLAPTAGLSGPKRLMAVDDSPTFLAALGDALRDDGYEVVLATSGEQALELLNVQAVDAILLDMVMPGLDGCATCRRIKDHPDWRQIPVIILTAHESRDSMLQGIDAGADDYGGKSADFDVIRAGVRAALRRRQFELENQRMFDEVTDRRLQAAPAEAARELAETRARLLELVQEKNRELESRNREISDALSELDSFTRTVSHDLRAPARRAGVFAKMLSKELGDSLSSTAQRYLDAITNNARRMEELIEDLMALARIKRAVVDLQDLDLVPMARGIFAGLQEAEPERQVEVILPDSIPVRADKALCRVALENLLGNSWKYTGREGTPRIEMGTCERNGSTMMYVLDNGVGFDMKYAHKLFQPFERLHSQSQPAGVLLDSATRRTTARRWARHARRPRPGRRMCSGAIAAPSGPRTGRRSTRRG